MDVRVYNLINNTQSVLFINSNDTVYDIKNIICSSLFHYTQITASGTNLFYIDKKTGNRNYMFSPYRTILSYKGIFQTKELYKSWISIRLYFCYFIREFITFNNNILQI